MQGVRDNWEVIRPLGSGGQSDVYLVRRSERIKERMQDIETIHSYNPWGTSASETRVQRTGEFAQAVLDYARQDRIEELGAMKVFNKLRRDTAEGDKQALSRLETEVNVLRQNYTGLPRLLDYNVSERWMVTEYFPTTLENSISRYKGNALLSLKAFLSIVRTVADLHGRGIIHRDIKPANIFIRNEDELVLGDLGIVFLANQPTRFTITGESVGPYDYMPPWGEGDRLHEVQPNFDVYMLGKLLWCMTSGRLRLQREYFDREANDVTLLFPDDPGMYMVNEVLRKCLVEHPGQCEISAQDLVMIVSTFALMLERGGQLLHAGIPRPCRACGRGHYQREFPSTQPRIPADAPVGLRLWIGGSETATVPVFPYMCDTCGHVEFFTRDATRPGSRGSAG